MKTSIVVWAAWLMTLSRLAAATLEIQVQQFTGGAQNRPMTLAPQGPVGSDGVRLVYSGAVTYQPTGGLVVVSNLFAGTYRLTFGGLPGYVDLDVPATNGVVNAVECARLSPGASPESLWYTRAEIDGLLDALPSGGGGGTGGVSVAVSGPLLSALTNHSGGLVTISGDLAAATNHAGYISNVLAGWIAEGRRMTNVWADATNALVQAGADGRLMAVPGRYDANLQEWWLDGDHLNVDGIFTPGAVEAQWLQVGTNHIAPGSATLGGVVTFGGVMASNQVLFADRLRLGTNLQLRGSSLLTVEDIGPSGPGALFTVSNVVAERIDLGGVSRTNWPEGGEGPSDGDSLTVTNITVLSADGTDSGSITMGTSAYQVRPLYNKLVVSGADDAAWDGVYISPDPYQEVDGYYWRKDATLGIVIDVNDPDGWPFHLTNAVGTVLAKASKLPASEWMDSEYNFLNIPTTYGLLSNVLKFTGPAPLEISASAMPDNSIPTGKYADKSVTAGKVADGTLTDTQVENFLWITNQIARMDQYQNLSRGNWPHLAAKLANAQQSRFYILGTGHGTWPNFQFSEFYRALTNARPFAGCVGDGSDLINWAPMIGVTFWQTPSAPYEWRGKDTNWYGNRIASLGQGGATRWNIGWNCDSFTVFYLKRPGGGVFKIQKSVNNGGMTDVVTNIDTASGSFGIGSYSWTEGSPGSYKVQALQTSTNGVCEFIAGTFYNSTIKNGFLIGGMAQAASGPGNMFPSWATHGAAVHQAFYQALDLDMMVICVNSGGSSLYSGNNYVWNATPNIPEIVRMLRNSCPDTDLLFAGNVPMWDTGTTFDSWYWGDMAIREVVKTNTCTSFCDTRSILGGDLSVLRSRGYTGDSVHPPARVFEWWGKSVGAFLNLSAVAPVTAMDFVPGGDPNVITNHDTRGLVFSGVAATNLTGIGLTGLVQAVSGELTNAPAYYDAGLDEWVFGGFRLNANLFLAAGIEASEAYITRLTVATNTVSETNSTIGGVSLNTNTVIADRVILGGVGRTNWPSEGGGGGRPSMVFFAIGIGRTASPGEVTYAPLSGGQMFGSGAAWTKTPVLTPARLGMASFRNHKPNPGTNITAILYTNGVASNYVVPYFAGDTIINTNWISLSATVTDACWAFTNNATMALGDIVGSFLYELQ